MINPKKSKNLVAIALAGSVLAGCPKGCDSDRFLKEGEFRGCTAKIGLNAGGRFIRLETREYSPPGRSEEKNYLIGLDKNENGHFEEITIHNGDLSFYTLQRYARDDSLEVAYQSVLNQNQ